MSIHRRYKHYSTAEDAVLLANPDMPTEQLAKMLTALGESRDIISVRHRRKKLGVAMFKPEWSDAETERLRAYWLDENLSSAQVHRAWPEKSRAAINSKVKRMGWPKTPEQRGVSPPKPPKPVKLGTAFIFGRGPGAEATPKPPRPEACAGPTPDSLNIRMWDPRFKSGCCKYATDEDDGGYFFCGAHAKPGLPYCGPHAAVCFNGYGTRPPEAPSKDRTAKVQPQDDGEPKALDFEDAA